MSHRVATRTEGPWPPARRLDLPAYGASSSRRRRNHPVRVLGSRLRIGRVSSSERTTQSAPTNKRGFDVKCGTVSVVCSTFCASPAGDNIRLRKGGSALNRECLPIATNDASRTLWVCIRPLSERSTERPQATSPTVRDQQIGLGIPDTPKNLLAVGGTVKVIALCHLLAQKHAHLPVIVGEKNGQRCGRRVP